MLTLKIWKKNQNILKKNYYYLIHKYKQMAKINFGGVEENVITREEFPLSKAQEVLKNEVIAVIGYGVQGPAQALNMKDNGIKVIIGQSPDFKADWDRAIKDGFVPGETLFPIEEAAKKATIIQYLVSDAAQRAVWPILNHA
jgi:ketol-acid reductoisomerase